MATSTSATGSDGGVRKDARIFVAGHRGMVGSAVVRALEKRGYRNLVLRTHAQLDLLRQDDVRTFFETERPDHVVLAAAKVGGIVANSTAPADFIYENVAIEANVIHASWQANVKRLLFLGSSCIYPRDCPQPIKEEYLLTGPLEATNRAYAIAKIAGIEMCAAYNRQHGTEYACAMPTNLFGPGDNYDLQTSHVLPALIRKAHESKVKELPHLVAWGTGKPRRELLLSDDLAAACVDMMEASWARLASLFPSAGLPMVNIGTGNDLTIAELTALVCEVVGYRGSVTWDTSKPDGTPRKLLDVSRIRSLGWEPRTPLAEGIRLAYQDFLRQAPATTG
ncbi:GDP-L-fucose synthase family protein [Usitatibacter rugosus]|nr:GDP-L-fucose synthase [Usitatibacter rugosus]